MYFYFLYIMAVMSIFVLIKKINNPRNKLQVKGCKENTYSSSNRCRDKSTFSLSLRKGSITLEAAIVLPVFILFIFSIYSFFYVLNYQNIMQMSVNNAGESIGRYLYILEKGEEYGNTLLKDSNKISVDKEIITKGAGIVYVWNKIFTAEVEKCTKSSNVIGGKTGINILKSSLDNDTGENDLIVEYKIGISVLGVKNIKYKLANRCYFRAWIGESIVDITNEIKQKMVYVTSGGKVYHLYRDCTHIKLSLSAVKFKDIQGMRNSSGGKYYKCDKCIHNKVINNDTVYITDNGTSYHISSKCSGIKRNVSEINISDVGARKLCSRCKQKYEKNLSTDK